MDKSQAIGTQAASLKDHTVIVSGGAGVIGRAVCLALGAAGANVVVNDVKVEAVEELVSSLSSKGYSALAAPMSATLGKDIVDATIAKFGAIHAVVNPILATPQYGPYESVTDDQFQTSFLVNVMGPLSILRAAWPHFQKQKYGRAVNFTSDGMLGFPYGSAYTMAKGALFGVNKTLAAEGAAHNINVNCVSPIAYQPSMEPHIKDFPENAQKAFKTSYMPEANVPMILALISEQCNVSGEVFAVAGTGAARNVWGVQGSVGNLRTVGDCLGKMSAICDRGTQSVFEPTSMLDFTEYHMDYTHIDFRA